MTGFGRDEGRFEEWDWVWELRSVNAKGLDLRLRLPQGFESLEIPVRKRVAKSLTRGAVQVSLSVQSQSGAGRYVVNTDWLEQLITHSSGLSQKHPDLHPATIGELLQIEGVIAEQNTSASGPELTARNKALLASLERAVKALKSSRRKEGRALARVLTGQMKDFRACLERAKSCDGVRLETIRQNLASKIAELAPEGFGEERLAQEVALLAVKADVREEIDRLEAHLAQAKSLLKTGSPVGRKLDFLVQEFMREINTLCSKSGDIDLTQAGLAMKSLIEQFREQAANVE